MQVFDESKKKERVDDTTTRVQTRLADSQRSRISRASQHFLPLPPRDSELQLIGSQASMKHRYASDVFVRESIYEENHHIAVPQVQFDRDE